jgi:hypothetical protein
LGSIYTRVNGKILTSIAVVLFIIGAGLFILYIVLDNDYLGITAILVDLIAIAFYLIAQKGAYRSDEPATNRFIRYGMKHPYLCGIILCVVGIIISAVITGEYLIALLLTPVWIFALALGLLVAKIVIDNWYS